MNKPVLVLGAALAAFGVTSVSNEASAQMELTLRVGGDIRPIIAFSSQTDGVATLDDVGWLGIHIAPGLELVEVLTLELDLIPLIPIKNADFEFQVAPGARLDLGIAYGRLSLPIGFGDEVHFWIEGAVGISLLQYFYLGVQLDYFTDGEIFIVGLEAGLNFDVMEL